MTCKSCGAEIADKALICYRCGASTFEPPAAPGRRPGRKGRRPDISSVLALVVLVVAALLMSRAAAGETPPVLSWVLVGLAALALVIRLLRRRR